MAQALKVLHLRHYLKGDDANAQGIAYAVAGRLNGTVESIDCHLRTNALVPVVRKLIKWRRGRPHPNYDLGLRLWPWLFAGRPPGASSYAAVVSTLGRGEVPAAYISSFWRAPAIHLGSPKRMREGDLTAAVTHQGHEAKPGEIVLPIAPTRILRSPQYAPHRRCVTVLAGGNAEGVVYSNQFWRSFISQGLAFADEENQESFVVTSPRTGSAERTIEASARELGLPPQSVVLYGRPSARSYAEILHSSSTVFVTAESVSMISDAIAAGARVVAAFERELPRSDRIRRFLEQQKSCRRITLVDLSDESRAVPDLTGMETLSCCWSDVLWEQLKFHFNTAVEQT